VSVCLMAGVGLWGCAAHEPSPPPQPPADVSKHLIALEECITRTQGGVKAATEAGVSAGLLAPINSSIADAQDAVDDGKRLAQQGQQQAATERLTQGLGECAKLDTMIVKVRQDAVERQARSQLAADAEARLASTATCIDGARQAVRSASAARVKGTDLTAAKSALDSAEMAMRQALESLAQHDPKAAIGRLEAAQTACQTAQEASDKATTAPRKSAAPPARPYRGY
jgi:hypothetical protein